MTEEPFKIIFDKTISRGIDAARQIINAAISYGPLISMAALVGKLYLHDLLVDCTTAVTQITLSLVQKILEANPEISIKYDRSLNIGGVMGKSTMKEYLITELDFGQGVKVKDILNKYVSDNHWLAKDLVPSEENLIASAVVFHPTQKEIEIEKKHLKKCASLMVEDWSYFKEEKKIEGGKETEEEKGIREGNIYKVEEYCFEEDLEFEEELEKANTKEEEKKKQPSMEEVEDETFAAESIAKIDG
ncbi:hypothetical protein BDD12DRAFT_883952 [Trichophaea hybrida]|nr:hypothetical protein BDD12DRAFT_883952 [Trichophaea hybrida]